jgi:hypothetical protein
VKFAQSQQIESLEAAYFEAIEQWRKRPKPRVE